MNFKRNLIALKIHKQNHKYDNNFIKILKKLSKHYSKETKNRKKQLNFKIMNNFELKF